MRANFGEDILSFAGYTALTMFSEVADCGRNWPENQCFRAD